MTPFALRRRPGLALLIALLGTTLLMPALARDDRDLREDRELRSDLERSGDRARRTDEDTGSRTRSRDDGTRRRREDRERAAASGGDGVRSSTTDTAGTSTGDATTLRAASTTDSDTTAQTDARTAEEAAKAAEDAADDRADADEDAAREATRDAEDRAEDLARAADDAEDAADDEEDRRDALDDREDGRGGDRYRIERDRDGRERLRGEVLMIGQADAVARVRAAGYAVRSQQRLAAPDESVLRIAVPAGQTVEQAMQRLRELAPAAVVAPNHIYRPSQAAVPATALPSLPIRAGSASPRHAIGIIDTGVDTRSAPLAAAVLRRQPFTGAPYTARAHGTLVAELAAMHGASLVVADVFGSSEDRRLVAPADAIAAAIAWLIAEQVPVINISIEGPDNAVMALLVQRAIGAGVVVVAAAGNGGPAAAPVYPAAYSGVIAVTAIDARDQVYRRANRGSYISFAAPGVDVVSVAGSYDRKPVSGTSFAAPRAAALIARRLSEARGDGRPVSVAVVLAELRHAARDLGVLGRDPVYGWGALLPVPPVAGLHEARSNAGGNGSRVLP